MTDDLKDAYRAGSDAIAIAQAGFREWADKPRNAKWARKLDGTPVGDDLTVCIAMRFAEALAACFVPVVGTMTHEVVCDLVGEALTDREADLICRALTRSVPVAGNQSGPLMVKDPRPYSDGARISVKELADYYRDSAINANWPISTHFTDFATVLEEIATRSVPTGGIEQCCMCGKKGLSTVEDGGPECELHDGRWVCSSECYDTALALMERRSVPTGAKGSAE